MILIQIWDIVEKYDTGCTAGGGRDSMNVFYDAGLLFESNLVPGTNYRKGETLTSTSVEPHGSIYTALHVFRVTFCSVLTLLYIVYHHHHQQQQ